VQFDENILHFQNFTRTPSEDFELLINLIGPKVVEARNEYEKCDHCKNKTCCNIEISRRRRIIYESAVPD